MSDKIKITPVNRGKRPAFFDDPAIDQLMAIVMSMSAEMSVLYDRVDTIERLLDKKRHAQSGRYRGFPARPRHRGRAKRSAQRLHRSFVPHYP